MAREAREPRRELVDRVVLAGQRAVAAGVPGLEPEAHAHLLGGLHPQQHGPPLARHLGSAALVQRELRLDQGAIVLQEPAHPVPRRARAELLVRGQGQDQVAIRHVAFLLVADQVGHEDRGHGLVVHRAARVEVAVFLDQLEGIALPVLALRLDHVEVGQQEQRLLRAAALEPRHQVALLRRAGRDDDPHVGLGEAAGPEPGRHRARGRGGVADRIGGVDLDQLLVDLAQEGLVGRGGTGRRKLRLGRDRPREQEQRQGQTRARSHREW